MTYYKGNHTIGSVGSSNASDLKDKRGGARDNVVSPPTQPGKERATEHQHAQPGADVRPEKEPTDDRLPEGLKRERKGPYGPTVGRSTDVPEHVPTGRRRGH